jgi:DNA polymerase-3 subunit beta
MKFIASSTSLYSHLQAVNRVINSKNTLPILDCFLFQLMGNALSMTASDTETTLSTTVEVMEADSEGSFAIVAKTLLEALREIPEQPLTFELNIDGGTATVHYRNGQYNLPIQDAKEYPTSPALGEKAFSLDMEAEVAMNGINRALFATADDELRPVMNGIYFDLLPDELVMVASDGHKLVRYKSQTTKTGGQAAFILPKKPANLLKTRLPRERGTLKIGFDDRNAVFETETFRMICRLIEGRYPNYNSVIPTNNPYHVTVDRVTLIGALRRVSIFSSQSSSLIKLKLENNRIVTSAQDLDFSTSAEEVVDCQYEGQPMSIGFKATFLIEVLSNISADEIQIELADPSRPGVILPTRQNEGEHLLTLLMPMMLND